MNPWLAARWLFFDQALFLVFKAALSTFFLAYKERLNAVNKPVDKSVVKLWKDLAEGRSYWLGAIAGLTARSGK
ncbi:MULTISPECIES: hypothetical protein [Pseudomonas]|uniref:hypothetical protein n=1 Tax=Pseudomonas TaxID=286 RepID=UPI001CDCCD47|nr:MULTISPECIES: hypothetical protein [Pseudomonas]